MAVGLLAIVALLARCYVLHQRHMELLKMAAAALSYHNQVHRMSVAASNRSHDDDEHIDEQHTVGKKQI